MNKSIKILVTTAILLVGLLTFNTKAQTTNCANVLFGNAQSFNVFIKENISLYNSDTEGRMAAGGNIFLKNYSVGFKLSDSNGSRDDLISANNITFINGKVDNGNAVYGGSNYLENVELPHGTIRQDSVIDFNSSFTQLYASSSKLSGLTGNGNVQVINGDLVLSGGDNNENIFNISSTQISSAYNIIINVPSDSSTLINVSGSSVIFKNIGISGQNLDSKMLLWNFVDANSLSIENVAVFGSILAPYANVNFNSAVQNGVLIANSLNGGSEGSNAGQNNTTAVQNNTTEFNGCFSDPEGAITTPVPTTTVPVITSTPTITPCACGQIGGETTVTPIATPLSTSTPQGSVLGVSDEKAALANTGQQTTIFNIALGIGMLVTIAYIIITRNSKLLVKIKSR